MSDCSDVFSSFFSCLQIMRFVTPKGAPKFYTFTPEVFSWAALSSNRSLKALQTKHWPGSVEVARMVIRKNLLNSGLVNMADTLTNGLPPTSDGSVTEDDGHDEEDQEAESDSDPPKRTSSAATSSKAKPAASAPKVQKKGIEIVSDDATSDDAATAAKADSQDRSSSTITVSSPALSAATSVKPFAPSRSKQVSLFSLLSFLREYFL